MASLRSRSVNQSERLHEILAQYLEAVEAGQPPDRAALLAAHPELAVELASFFRNQQQLQPLLRPTSPSLPRQVGDYELLEEIARGGMGVVYRARQVSLNRIVAYKTVRQDMTDAEAQQRFQAEAEAIARLDHPGIITIHEIGQADGVLFFSMQYLAGGNLAQWANAKSPHQNPKSQIPNPKKDQASQASNGPGLGFGIWDLGFSKRQLLAAQLLIQVTRAVQHAHERGVLHRDLKPANILLPGGEGPLAPVVTDFGLSKMFRRASQITQSVHVVGTACYMAPEQAFPDRAPLTVAADIYSLGAILYFLLVGRPPFEGQTPFDTLLKVVQEPLVPPRQVVPGIDKALEAICLHCLHKEPARRYRSAAALAQDLEAWTRGESVSVVRLTPRAHLRRLVRRYPLAMGIVVTTLVALMLLIVGQWLGLGRLATQRDEAEQTARNERVLRDQAESLAESERLLRAEVEDARNTLLAGLERETNLRQRNVTLLNRHYVDEGMRQLMAGDPAGALVWLNESLVLEEDGTTGSQPRVITDPARQRIAFALARCPRLVRMWFPTTPAEHLLIGSDGKQILFTSARDNVHLGQMANGAVTDIPGLLHDPVVAARRPLLAAVNDKEHARLWDLTTGQPWPNQPSQKKVKHLALSRDGKRLALACADHTVHVWDVDTANDVAPAAHLSSAVQLLTFSPNGRWLATAAGPTAEQATEVRIWSLAGLVPVVLKSSSHVRSFAFNADSNRLLVVTGRNSARMWEVATGKQLGHTTGQLAGAAVDVLSRDGDQVLVREGPRLRTRALSDDRATAMVLVHPADVELAGYSPDHRHVATVAADRGVRVWDCSTGKGLLLPVQSNGRIVALRFSSDSRYLALLTNPPLVQVYDLAGGPESVTDLPPADQGNVLAMGNVASDQRGPARLLLKRPDGTLVLFHGAGKTALPLGKTVATHGMFSHDGHWLLTAGPGQARFWDARTGEPASPLLRLEGNPRHLAFSIDDSRGSLLDDGGAVYLWKRDGVLVSAGKVPAPQRQELTALSADGQFLAVAGSERTVDLRQAPGYDLIIPPQPARSQVSCLAFREDGELLLQGFLDGSVGLWKPKSSEPMKVALGHSHPIRLACFSTNPVGLVATAQEEGTVIVWDCQTGLPITPPLAHEGPVVEMRFNSTSTALLTRTSGQPGIHGKLHCWRLRADPRPASDLVALAQFLAGKEVHPASGSLMNLPPADFRTLWPQLQRRFQTEFAGPE